MFHLNHEACQTPVKANPEVLKERDEQGGMGGRRTHKGGREEEIDGGGEILKKKNT